MSILTQLSGGDRYFDDRFKKTVKSLASCNGNIDKHLKGDLYFEFDNDDKLKSYAAEGTWFKSGEIGVLDFSDIKGAVVSINGDIKILNIGEDCSVNLPNTFVNVANHIKVIDYNSGLTEEEMKRCVYLADCVIMYADAHKCSNVVAQSNISERLSNVPVYFVSEEFMEKHEQRRKDDDHIVVDNILNPDWLAFYSRWPDDACEMPQPHICICPKRMEGAISYMNRALGKQVQMKKFMYAIVLIHEFAHAVMDKSNPKLRYLEEAYFIEEPLANVVALKYTEAFKQAERCPEGVHLNDIAKLFIKDQIYPYNAAPVFVDVDIKKWMELKY